MPVTSAQVRMARAALNWSVRDLAEAARIHRNTVTNIETGRYAGDAATLRAKARWGGIHRRKRRRSRRAASQKATQKRLRRSPRKRDRQSREVVHGDPPMAAALRNKPNAAILHYVRGTPNGVSKFPVPPTMLPCFPPDSRQQIPCSSSTGSFHIS